MVFSVIGASGVFWSASYDSLTAQATDEVTYVEQVTGIDLPAQIDASRQAIFVSGVYPSRIFYKNVIGGRVFYASAAYKFGKGYLIINGISADATLERAKVVSKVAAATALFMKLVDTHPYPKIALDVKPPIYVLAIPNVASSWTALDNNLDTKPGIAEEYYEAIQYIGKTLGIQDTY